METAGNFEQNQNLYREIQTALEDAHLSSEEKTDIISRYNQEIQLIGDELQDATSALRNEILEDKRDIYLELRDIFRSNPEDIKKLQTLAGVGVDGLIGPQTFAGFLRLYTRFPEFQGLGPTDVLEKYNEIYDSIGSNFSNKTLEERRNIQREVGTRPDGVFGPNTFRSILEKWEDIKEYFSADISSDVPQEIIIEQSEEETEEIIVESLQNEDIEPEELESLGVPENLVMLRTEKIERLREQAREIPESLIRLLQISIGTDVDGVFGPLSAEATIDAFPDYNDLGEILDYLNISLESDGPLSRDGSPEVFRNQYDPFIIELARQFAIPVGLIDSIIGRETTYGANLVHSGGSKGMMQLTNIIFEDMRQAGRRERFFRPLFQQINIENLAGIELGDSTLAGENMPGPIQDVFTVLANPETSNNVFDANIIILQNFLKGDSSYYNHITNMIVGSLWLAHNFHQNNGDVYNAARNYNGNPAIRDAYARNIVERYNAYHTGGDVVEENIAGAILNSEQVNSAINWIESRVSELNLQRLAEYFQLERGYPDFISELAQRVAEHQGEHGLTVDGKPGNQTLGSIDFGDVNIGILPENQGEFISSLPENWREIGMKFLEELRPNESLEAITSLQLFDPVTRRGFVRLPSGDAEIPILCGRGATLRNTLHRVHQIIITDSPHGDASNGGDSNTVRAASFISDIAGANGGKWAPHGVDTYRISGDYSGMQTLGCIGIESNLMHQIATQTIINSGAAPTSSQTRTNYVDGTRNSRDGRTQATRYSIPVGKVYTFTA